jgi:hypothetical protein
MPEKKDFIIKDRRRFFEEKEDEKKQEEKVESQVKETDAQPAEDAATSDEAPKDYPLPEINFPFFILSLNSSALLHLGIINDPTTDKKVKNLPLAKQTIDILGMLEEKTRGNLTQDEENMLKNILYDLRIIYVKEKG